MDCIYSVSYFMSIFQIINCNFICMKKILNLKELKESLNLILILIFFSIHKLDKD